MERFKVRHEAFRVAVVGRMGGKRWLAVVDEERHIEPLPFTN